MSLEVSMAYPPTQEFAAFVGIDWADTTHAVWLQAAGSETREAGALTQLACSDGGVVFEATAGTTYYFMVGSWDSGPGGTMAFQAGVAPPPLELDVAANAQGLVNPSTGVAVVRGTVSCNTAATIDYVAGTLQQKQGRSAISTGFGTSNFACTPPMVPWSATTSVGPFTSGTATIVGLETCGYTNIDYVCTRAQDPITITLRPKSKR
jgi:hypothetical protein